MAGKKDSRVDDYLARQEQWREQLQAFREVLLAAGLDEAIRWGIPAYLFEGVNLIGYAGFKRHCALWFHQGVFLKDEACKLSSPRQSDTQAMRQWKFAVGEEVPRELLRDYAREAIANHQADKRHKPVSRPLRVPRELEQTLREDAALNAAFARLTLGKRKEYAEHIGGARQERTRRSRLMKARPLILAGSGLNDKYRR